MSVAEETLQKNDYDFCTIEKTWQKFWLSNKTFKTSDSTSKPKYYILDMFPYPSGDGLHVGHPEGYTATDIVARFKRMNGFNVLHPMGWDAFGLPAEQYAIQNNVHPRVAVAKNVERFRQQIQSIGLSYDWDREINTTDEKYYKWTQWIFLKLYEKGLAFESFEPVNWCPALGTVLANEEVIDGKSERGGHPVIKKPMRQWKLRITAYAERLLQDLDSLEWPESLKEMQRNWIGKSYGATVRFAMKGNADATFQVFTTRPDTLFGATFCVVAPEHPIVNMVTTPDCLAQVSAYVESAVNRSDMERTALNKEKTGVFTGAYAINPANKKEIPVFIADYVLMSYGEGAIMAVPGHDERDHEFALTFGLPIVRVLSGGEGDISERAHTGDGTLVDSGFLNGLAKSEAIQKMISWLEAEGIGRGTVNYKMRDWLFSRQRYWGEPFPIVHDQNGKPFPVDSTELPVKLPELQDFQPTGSGEPPLARASEWLKYHRGSEVFSRETNTMPQWAGSCWYYLRYIDPDNQLEPWSKAKESYWMPVDLYVGGVEHAVLHLLYARFWHKVLYDCGLVSTKEPFQRLVNQGMILGENNEKMSKSRGNVINPDAVIAEWGADSLRLYEMFMGPLEATKPWQTKGIGGCHRFLRRVWRLIINEEGKINSLVTSKPNSEVLDKALHRTIAKVTSDTEGMRFNTAIAAMMEFVNTAYKEENLNIDGIKKFVLVLSPYAPHLCEELWQRLGGNDTLAYHPWPEFDAALTIDDTVTVSVQVNGKLRGTVSVPKGSIQDYVVAESQKQSIVARNLEDKTIVKTIFVQDKIVNFVVK